MNMSIIKKWMREERERSWYREGGDIALKIILVPKVLYIIFLLDRDFY